jgi:hypothetical protein
MTSLSFFFITYTIYFEAGMSEEEEKEDVVIQGDIAEAMRLQEKKEIDRPAREAAREEKGEEERIPPVPSATVAPKISKTPKKSIKKNQNDATIASISEQLEKQANTIDKIGANIPTLQKYVKSVQKQSELIKQIQSQIKQLEKQVSQVGSSIQRSSSTGRRS